MTPVIDSFVPSAKYNSLPTISEVESVPRHHSDDLRDLQQLLDKHNVPDGVSIRLIHKHFDAADGEIMVFEKVAVPDKGFVKIMKPLVPAESNRLRGIHYFVDDDASLQAYEYAPCEIPDMDGFDSFLAEFCALVGERGLQRKFGLKLQCRDDTDKTGWTEFEFGQKRGTIMIPDGLPMPKGDATFTITTEWAKKRDSAPPVYTCSHCSHHCTHCSNHRSQDADDSGMCL